MENSEQLEELFFRIDEQNEGETVLSINWLVDSPVGGGGNTVFKIDNMYVVRTDGGERYGPYDTLADAVEEEFWGLPDGKVAIESTEMSSTEIIRALDQSPKYRKPTDDFPFLVNNETWIWGADGTFRKKE